MLGRAGRYLAVTYGVSWSAWGVLLVSGSRPFSLPGLVAFLLGGLGPAVAGVGLTVAEGAEARREYWRRLVDLSRVGPTWTALVLALPPLVVLGGTLGARLGGQSGRLLAETAPETLPALLLFLLVTFLFGPLPEELGWRGYLLDPLLNRFGALWASLAVGVVWALWHLPLFFVLGTYQAGLGVGTPAFWLFAYFVVAYSVLYTWVHVHTGRSILAATLFHFAINASGELFRSTLASELVSAGLVLGAVALVVLVAGPDTLRRDGPMPV
jgi:membrane protease YdiL (CAAX protease family)